jgi:hypothetical protein
MNSVVWAVRLHWRLVVVVALVASSLLAGLALARGPAGQDRMRKARHGHKLVLRGVSRRVAVKTSPPSRETSSPASSQAGVAASETTAAGAPEQPPPPSPADTTAPQTSITSGPAATTTSTSASFAFNSSEGGSSFECKLDGGSWAACTAPEAYTGLAVGPHQFSVRAIDPAENVDPTPAASSWTIETEGPPPPDTTPPQTSITGGPAATTTATSASFTFTSNEAGSSFECKLDGGSWGACATPEAYSGLALGSHQFSVQATDPANNVDPTPAASSWTIGEPPPPPPPPPPPAECSTVVTSTSAAEAAVSSAAGGTVVCLADGSYGNVSISALKSTQVTLQAEHPGRTTIAGASLDGSHLALTHFNITDEVTVQPGSEAIAIEYNRITGGYMGINAGPTSSTSISDTTIRGNQLVGPFGEDALRINRYHDSADADPYGILIEGNEISGVRENGNHSDCLQSVWGGDGLYFRRNYLHDNRCQGFFVKDQPSTIVGISLEDNLFLRDSEPCDPPSSDCGQPSYLQIFGPYEGFTMRRNTVWQGEVVASFQEGTGPDTTIEANVVNRFWTNTNMSSIAYSDNTRCQSEGSAGGSWPEQAPGETVDCSPAFNDPGTDDFRLIGSNRGVDWAPAEQHYGP